jgi:hypothetical protein
MVSGNKALVSRAMIARFNKEFRRKPWIENISLMNGEL